jgi:hypothetical protein
LKRTIYGIKQAAFAFWKELSQKILASSFEKYCERFYAIKDVEDEITPGQGVGLKLVLNNQSGLKAKDWKIEKSHGWSRKGLTNAIVKLTF